MCMREGVLVVMMDHGAGHVGMVLEGHAAIRMSEQRITWGGGLLDVVGGTEHAMVCSTGPR